MTTYTENPDNYNEIKPFVVSDLEEIKNVFHSSPKVIFYDACSFQTHSHLKENEKNVIIKYFKKQEAMIIITRCVLMELSSDRHKLEKEYVSLVKKINESNIPVVVFDEEYIYSILSDCFFSNEKINEYLVWAVRTVKSPVSTITETLKENDKLSKELNEGKNLKQSDIYNRFFKSVRGNKEHSDNLGEELIAICLHILSHLPGIHDGKLCVVTDDKGAAGKINSVMERTNPPNRGAEIIIFSTPKLVQFMYQEGIGISEDNMKKILAQGASGNVSVMGITPYDLDVNEKMSMSVEELVQKIMKPNQLLIVF